MGKIHRLRIIPGSEGEEYFMNLLNDVGVKHDSVICKLGTVFNTPYNEYTISDGLFKQIRSYLMEKKGLSLLG